MTGVSWVDHGGEGDPSVGWMGGFFREGMRWPDYIGAFDDAQTREALELIRESIVANRVWIAGDEHQDGEHGTPRLPDGRRLRLSFRAWGDLMAAVWSTALGRDLAYMDFYYAGTPAKPEVWP